MALDFFSILKSTCSRYNNIYVTVTDSKYWGRQGQRWLAQYVASLLVDLGFNPMIISKDVSDWEHKNFKILDLESVLSTASAEDTLIIFSVSHHCNIAQAIRNLNRFSVHDCTAYAIDDKKVGGDYILKESERINQVFSLLGDPESKSVYFNMLSARIFGHLNSIQLSKFNIYYHPAFNNFENIDGIVIDGGSYDGEDSYKFSNCIHDNNQVHGFEFDKSNYDRFLTDTKGNCKVRFFNQGLWSKSSKAKSAGTGIATRVKEANESPEETGLVDLVALDQIYYQKQRVGFIKLDVEGAEWEALNGAKKIIESDKPYLAVSIYHRPNDLWELPLLIKSFNSNYRFFLGQHDRLLSETVLYCI
jgi:FkbM family methyltransferase